MPVLNDEIVTYFINKSKDAEELFPYDARSWLLMGRSLFPDSFLLEYQSYCLERKLGNVAGAAQCIESLFRKFENKLLDEIGDLAKAELCHHLNKEDIKEKQEDMQFYHEVFATLPKDIQMEIMIRRSESAPTVYEKCQAMLLLVKLYPETVNKHGGDLLLALLSCETDAFSNFRRLLVVELVPSFLELSDNLETSPVLFTLLGQCIEYYVLMKDDQDKCDPCDFSRWRRIFETFDKIGALLSWKIVPFFTSPSHLQSSINTVNELDDLLGRLDIAFRNKEQLTLKELAYTCVTGFLTTMVSFSELKRDYSTCNTTDSSSNSALTLVEVFIPPNNANTNKTELTSLPVLTASACSTLRRKQNEVMGTFKIAAKIWGTVHSPNHDELKKEFYSVLYSLKSLNLERWDLFNDFLLDYKTYTNTHHYNQDCFHTTNPIKLCSMAFSVHNHKVAIQNVFQKLNDIDITLTDNEDENVEPECSNSFSKEEFNFFSSQVYTCEDDDNAYKYVRRVHFLSSNPHEILAYCITILINALYEVLRQNSATDVMIGHLMTLLQMEWPSLIGYSIFESILNYIKGKRHFEYSRYFETYIIETDFLEELKYLMDSEAKNISINIIPTTQLPGAKRMGTRGAEKGIKDDIKHFMKNQMMKSGCQDVEFLVVDLLRKYFEDIFSIF